MVELVYTSVSKTDAFRHVSSTLTLGTIGEKIMEDKESESHKNIEDDQDETEVIDTAIYKFLDGFICTCMFNYRGD